ncbi:DUF4190 domain-containing protein [Sinomonas terrae]|uniref:DUF4190 domain-containing protein n=1 Tax=Sinomonas terrae TaxID=2908838 RepID=A0ABS9U6U5_9MICC|nr:DUF4190 domain-containing protein [Sinomonas terrae]MCH6472232.1 DUF4190 domain-containing protein [Sinomonas terrae]
MSESNEGPDQGESPREPADERPTEPISREHRHATRPIPPVPQAPSVPGASASPYGTSGPYSQGPYGQGPYSPNPYSQSPYSQNPYGTSPYGTSPYGTSPYAPGGQNQSAPPPYGQEYPPSYGYQQPQYPQPYSYAQPEPRTLSIVSMVCGIASLLGFGFLLLPQLAAIVLGHLALSREPAGRGFAIAGLATGYFCLLVSIVVIAFLVIGIASISQYSYNY